MHHADPMQVPESLFLPSATSASIDAEREGLQQELCLGLGTRPGAGLSQSAQCEQAVQRAGQPMAGERRSQGCCWHMNAMYIAFTRFLLYHMLDVCMELRHRNCEFLSCSCVYSANASTCSYRYQYAAAQVACLPQYLNMAECTRASCCVVHLFPFDADVYAFSCVCMRVHNVCCMQVCLQTQSSCHKRWHAAVLSSRLKRMSCLAT